MANPFDIDDQPVARRVADALTRVASALKSRSWQEGERLGLTPTQAEILALLVRPGNGGLGLSAVADRLQVTRPTASDAVAALVRKGLVAKGAAAEDRRAIILRLTETGRTAALDILEWPDFLTRAIATLPASDQQGLLSGLIGTIRALQVAGDIPVQRMCVTCRHFRPNAHPDTDAPHHCMLVDAAFADRHLRVDCPDQMAAD